MIAGTRKVVVVGGGISGLTIAWHLKRAGVDVCLLDAAPGVGGCIQTESRDGFLLEKGPFNVMVRDPSFEDLLLAVEDEVPVVAASDVAKKRYIYLNGRLSAVPTNPIALMTTGLLSLGGRLRLLRGLFVSGKAGRAEETIDQVATRRIGRQAADNLVSAAISGIFAGDTKKLSLSACFPTVGRIDAEATSLIGYGLSAALRKKKGDRPKRRWRGLVSIEGGLGALTGVLGRYLGADLLSGCRVESTTPRADGFDVGYVDAEGVQRKLACERLVLASSAHETGRLLAPALPEAASALGAIYSASLVVLNLGFRRTDVGHPLDGFGFLVPQTQAGFPLMGSLWADSIFPHHAPPDKRLIRVFIGGARDPGSVDRSDDELLTIAMDSLRGLLKLTGDPVLVDPCRYRAAIPQYHAGHRERIVRLRESTAKLPRLHLVGNYLEGVSLNDCVRLAARVAGEVTSASDSEGTAVGQPLSTVSTG